MVFKGLFRKAVLSDRAGSVALVSGLVFPIAIALCILGLDYANAVAARGGLQRAADAAALSGARQMLVASRASKSAAMSVASSEAREELQASAVLKQGSVRVVTVMDDATRAVTVEITADANSLLADHVLGRPIAVAARARALPVVDKSMCVMGLKASGTVLRLSGNGGIRANGCVVHANSSSTQALTVSQSARIRAHSICSVGGYRGSDTAMTPAPTTDCPVIDDPLVDRDPPKQGGCTFTNKSINHATQTWTPGIYCNGMYLNNGAKVTLAPGVYVLRGGTLNVEGGASLKGVGVTIVLTAGARLNILGNSTLDLGAPAMGPTAGLLMFGDRDAPPNSAHKIQSNDAHNLLGTIYLPAADLRIGGAAPIADKSPWTAVVAGSVQVEGFGEIVLNTDFDSTAVPLPSGLDGRARNLRLLD